MITYKNNSVIINMSKKKERSLMRNLKRVLGIMLAVMIAMGALAGCGQKAGNTTAVEFEYVKDENLNEPGTFPVCKEPITLKIGIPQNSFITDYENNSFTQLLEEKMNCNIEFQMLPTTDTMQKIELMMASGGDELPDIICGVNFTDGALSAYGSSGMIVPMNAYYENSAYYINDMLEAETDLLDMITSPDGNLYYIPQLVKAIQNEVGCSRTWINKKWLDKLGLDVPETMEEFKAVLKAFKEQDPNGNGKPDELPFTGSTNLGHLSGLEYLFASFVKFTPRTNYLYVNKKGKVELGFQQDGWKDAIKYCAELYKEGLISDSTFTLDNNGITPLRNNPNDAILGSFVSMSLSFDSKLADRYDEYVPLPPLESKNGRAANVVPSIPNSGFVITKNCKYPEAAFRLGDLMISTEMTLSNRFGVKGRDWNYATEDQKSMFSELGYDALVDVVIDTWGVPTNAHWEGKGAGYRSYKITAGQVGSESNLQETIVAKSTQMYLPYADMTDVKKFVYNAEDLESANEIITNLEAYVKEMTTSFIVGSKDVDKEWDGYLKQLENMGASQLIEYTQAAYDRVKEK